MSGVIGFVAFRSGSKRLPGKNGRKLGDKTLYQITLDKLVSLKRAGLLKAVVASTDSPEWRAHCADVYGDDVKIHNRPAEVSGDRSSDTEVVLDFFKQHPEFQGSAVLLTLCTYPFMKPSVLEQMVLAHQESGRSVFALTTSHHMPQKLLRVENGVLRPYLFDRMADFESNTKILLEHHPVAYHSTGAFLIEDAFQTMTSLSDLWHQDDIGYVVDDSFHVDIDNLEDFELAQLRFEQTKAYE
jgi:CMP-N-acetylneuraminic acid synthetase